MGLATLTITAVTAGPADFGVLSNCSSPVPAGSSCTVGVFFDPTAGGTRTGTLTFTDNAAGSPQTVWAEIERQSAELGINYLLTYLFLGTMSLAEALRSLELFGTEVMPKIAKL